MLFNKMQQQWKEDSPAPAFKKENISELIEENQRLLTVISSLKLKLKEAHAKYEQLRWER